MSDPAEESAAQLLARLASVCRPQLNDLDVNIFPNHGLFANEIAEIAGDEGLGKTTLLMHIMAKAMLPLEYGGKNGRIYLLLTEHNFDLNKFYCVLCKCIGDSTASTAPNDSESDLMSDVLQNLTIQRCFDETQFELAIYDLHRELHENNRYCLLVVDSIAAFYPTSRGRVKGKTSYVNDVLARLRLLVNEHHVTLVYTKPAYFVQKSSWYRTEGVTYFLELSNTANDDEKGDSNLVFKVDIPGTYQKWLRKYEFDANGCIEWK